MTEPHIYCWAKKRGFFGRTGGEMSHLLLDKGVLSVPESSHDEFISEYAKGVVKGGKFSCVVEVKPKIFRMFYDLDIVAPPSLGKMMTRGEFPPDIQQIFHLICGTTADSFDIDNTSITMCISNMWKKVDEGAKVGVHLTFDNIFVSSSTALHVRDKVLEQLAKYENPFVNPWESIVDAAVHKGSGMRLPWATKPKEPQRVYVPLLTYVLERGKDIREERIENVTTSFSSTRSILANVSLRARGIPTKLVDDINIVEFESPSYSGSIRHSSLTEYATVVEELEKIIPGEYEGRITGVLKTEHVYMFRHSSKYCANVQRQHHSSNTYFLVTPYGMRQCCYSRKVEYDEKRCPCSKFRGEYIAMPKKILDELFPETVQHAPRPLSIPTPSNATGFTMDKLAEIAANKNRPRKKTSSKQKPKKTMSYRELLSS